MSASSVPRRRRGGLRSRVAVSPSHKAVAGKPRCDRGRARQRTHVRRPRDGRRARDGRDGRFGTSLRRERPVRRKVVPHGGSGGHPRARGAFSRTALRNSPPDAKRQSPDEDPSSRGVRTVAQDDRQRRIPPGGSPRKKTPRPLRRPRSRGWKANPWFSMHGWRRFLGRGRRIRRVNVRKRGRASRKEAPLGPVPVRS